MLGVSVPLQALKSPSSLHFSKNLLIDYQAHLLQLRPLKPMRKENGRSYETTAPRRHRKKQIRNGRQKTSDLEDDLTARVTCFARFMRFRRAIKGTCKAYCRPELSLV